MQLAMTMPSDFTVKTGILNLLKAGSHAPNVIIGLTTHVQVLTATMMRPSTSPLNPYLKFFRYIHTLLLLFINCISLIKEYYETVTLEFLKIIFPVHCFAPCMCVKMRQNAFLYKNGKKIWPSLLFSICVYFNANFNDHRKLACKILMMCSFSYVYYTQTLATQFCPTLPYLHVVRLQFIYVTHHWKAWHIIRILIKFNGRYITFEVLRWVILFKSYVIWCSIQTDVQVPIFWTSCLAAMHTAITVLCVLLNICEVCWGFRTDTGYFAMSHGN